MFILAPNLNHFVESLPIIISILASIIVGISKAGVKGIGVFFVILLANAYEPKISTGILLPLLIVGDLFAIIYYKKNIVWKYIFQLIPWMAIGVLFATLTGDIIDEIAFKRLMSIVIFLSVLIMLFMNDKMSNLISKHWSFGPLLGGAAGFTTMIGNAAGPLANIYFIAMKVEKKPFISSSAYIFFLINIIKLPFHIFFWKTINYYSLIESLKMTPFVFLGLIIGVYIVDKITEKYYSKLILILTAASSIFFLFS